MTMIPFRSTPCFYNDKYDQKVKDKDDVDYNGDDDNDDYDDDDNDDYYYN